MDFSARRARKRSRSASGRAPARTYFYGHSAGARIGRGMNYTPGLNKGADGKPYLRRVPRRRCGAAGGWLPVLMKDGKDVLFATDAEKAAFVPQLDIVAPDVQQHLAVEEAGLHDRQLSREQAQQRAHPARQGPDVEVPHVRSAQHQPFGGERRRAGRRSSMMMDRFIDMLDAWVDKGVAPPPSRSDWAELGDANRDGTIEHAGARFPRGRVSARRLLPDRPAPRARRRLRRSPARASSRSTTTRCSST